MLTISNLHGNRYHYTGDLLALEGVAPPPPAAYGRAISSLHLSAWQTGLATFPDRVFAAYLLRGIEYGFRIGVPAEFKGRHAKRNLRSAYDHGAIVQEYLKREETLGRIKQVPPAEQGKRFQISPFGVIPKKNRPNKWRLIIDLSSPHGNSVNDAISSEWSSISYASLDDAAAFIVKLGPGCLLAKLDLKEAYRAVPIHPFDQPLLSVMWEGAVFIDRALPFGLRSAPKIFSALTDGLMWLLYQGGVQFALHYLDDFLILGPADSAICQAALDTTLSICEQVGLPVAPEKTEGPTTCLTFLGIEIDTQTNQLRLPQDKLDKLRSTIGHWMYSGRKQAPRRSGTKRDLLSLIGLLNHAAKVVRPGRAFLRGLIDTAGTVEPLDHYVHLNGAARAELAWWNTFLKIWNGAGMVPPSTPTYVVTSDASGGWGSAAIFNNLWFQLEWPSQWADKTIAPKELVPIVIAMALWGPQWAGEKVCALCDNMAVVCAVNKKSARDPALSTLLRILCILCAIYNVSLVARHLPGVENLAADALSRDRLPLFFSQNPQASPTPTLIPSPLRELVLNQELNCASQRWTELLRATLGSASLLPPGRHTPRLSAVMQPSATSSN